MRNIVILYCINNYRTTLVLSFDVYGNFVPSAVNNNRRGFSITTASYTRILRWLLLKSKQPMFARINGEHARSYVFIRLRSRSRPRRTIGRTTECHACDQTPAQQQWWQHLFAIKGETYRENNFQRRTDRTYEYLYECHGTHFPVTVYRFSRRVFIVSWERRRRNEGRVPR